MHQAVTERLGLGERQLAEFMADIWREYLGTANTELIGYAHAAASAIPHGDPE